ncbi:MAG: hypothetical protein ACRCYU_16905 [Nocardioides sp.]
MHPDRLSVDLSRLLIAFTIEVDNEVEHRMARAVPEPPFRISLVMWANFLRLVGDGGAVADLPDWCGLPKPRVLSTLGGMERWRYVYVAPPPAAAPPPSKREGYGSARALRPEWIVRPTATGAAAREIWPAVLADVTERWRARFGEREVGDLRDACLSIADVPAHEYLPVVTGTGGLVSELAAGRPSLEGSTPFPLSALLAGVLLAYTVEFEQAAPLSLPLTENVVRVLSASGTDVRELPAASRISPEAVTMSLNYLRRKGYVERSGMVRLTDTGVAAYEESRAALARVEQSWERRGGTERLRAATRAVLQQRDGMRSRLGLGLVPYPDGWRAERRYLPRTEAVLADPCAGLPRHPVVLPRGGWPDGS